VDQIEADILDIIDRSDDKQNPTNAVQVGEFLNSLFQSYDSYNYLTEGGREVPCP